MKTDRFGQMGHKGSTTVVSLILAFFASLASGQTIITFENIPATGTPVDDFSTLYPGITLTGPGWAADQADSADFQYIYNFIISCPPGGYMLNISFDSPAEDITMDLGSGELGVPETARVNGYLNGNSVFSDTFTTVTSPEGGEEVVAVTSGEVNSVNVFATAGTTYLLLDNLSYVTVPEPSTVALLAFGMFGLTLLRRRQR